MGLRGAPRASVDKLPAVMVLQGSGLVPVFCSVATQTPLSAPGHNVRLMPPAYVKPHVKRQKNDAADAEAICDVILRRQVTPSTPGIYKELL